MTLRLGDAAKRLRRVPAAPAFQVALGAAVKARRKELGLTQEQLALRGDLQQRWISNVETGKRNPSYASLRRLAVLLELTTAEMIDRAEASERGSHRDKSSQHAELSPAHRARSR